MQADSLIADNILHNRATKLLFKDKIDKNDFNEFCRYLYTKLKEDDILLCREYFDTKTRRQNIINTIYTTLGSVYYGYLYDCAEEQLSNLTRLQEQQNKTLQQQNQAIQQASRSLNPVSRCMCVGQN